MTPDSPKQKLIEALESELYAPFRVSGYSPRRIEEALNLARSLISELAELREKAEALEWFVKRLPMSMGMVISDLDDIPDILRRMIEQKERP